MRWTKDAKSILTSSSGYTLVEVIVAIGILMAILGLFSGALFQVLSIQRFWRDDVIATKELRHAGSWFSGDALNAETVDLVGCTSPPSCVKLTWADATTSTITHLATYSLSVDNLVRDYDGIQTIVARDVLSADFSLSSKTLTFDLGVKGPKGEAATSTLRSFLRKLN